MVQLNLSLDDVSMSEIKKIKFHKGENTRSFFDLVSLVDIQNLNPTDHNQFENHRLTFFALIFIIEGNGKHSINFQEHAYTRGTVFAIGPDIIHKFYKSDASGYLLVFTEDFILQYLNPENANRIFQLFNEQLISPKLQLTETQITRFLDYIDSIKLEFQSIQDGFSSELIRSLLHVIITHLLRIKSSTNQILKHTKYLDQFLEFQKLVKANAATNKSVSFYADCLNITPRTLNNITHAIVSKSAKSVINDIIILKIKRLLISTQLSASQIAYQCGFAEPSHLFKFFKKYANQSPKNFRSLFR